MTYPIDDQITLLCDEAAQTSKEKGFQRNGTYVPTCLALIHSEVSEALEVYRKEGVNDNFTEELADVAIRVFDLCGRLNLDLNNAVKAKMQVNRGRSYKHGKAL